MSALPAKTKEQIEEKAKEDKDAIDAQSKKDKDAIDAQAITDKDAIDAKATSEIATLTPAPGSSASSSSTSATIPATGGKKGVEMNLNLTADMKDDGTFETVKINESIVNGEKLKADPTKVDMKTILDKIPAGPAGGARKSRKSRKTKRTKKGGKKRRSTRRSR